MALWRQYLEDYAGQEGHPEAQIIIACNHSAEVFGFLSLAMDRRGSFRAVIEERIRIFQQGRDQAESFSDRLLNGTFALYNHSNTLCHQFALSHREAETLIGDIDLQLKTVIQSAAQIDRSAAAMRATFPLLCLITMILNNNGAATDVIRKIEGRFSAGSQRASSGWEQLVNAVYRIVELLQVFVSLSDSELTDQVGQIAMRFQEDDQTRDLRLKLRNGLCRTFELGHLLSIHLDELFS